MGGSTDLRTQLHGHVPSSTRETACVATVLAHLDALEQPYDERAQLVHVTGSAIVTGARGVVLHLHKRLGIWLQPGGHLDPGEEPWDAAVREAGEETGLADLCHPSVGPALLNVDVHAGPRGHIHLDCRYLVFASDAEPAPGEGESQLARWFGWGEALGTLGEDPQLVAALHRARDLSVRG